MRTESGIGNNLKLIRNRYSLSQQQLADAAGVTRQTIGGLESSQYAPSAAVALRIARALGCRVEDLFWLEEEKPIVEALLAGSLPARLRSRVALAQVGGRWIARALEGDQAFRTEMVPADGITLQQHEAGRLSVQLLDEQENLTRTVVIAGCTPALSLWARSAERWHPGLRVQWTHANSMAALHSLARGEVHAAGLHLRDPVTGDCNAPFVRRILPDRKVTLINLGTWEEGMLVRAGNPKGIFHGTDLIGKGVRMVNREPGAGARLLLDTMLQEERISPESVPGYDVQVLRHQDVASAVAAGQADVGISTESVAETFGLTFVPIRRVRFDLALLDEYLRLDPIRQLIETLHNRWIRSQLQMLGGYDTAKTGEIMENIIPGLASS